MAPEKRDIGMVFQSYAVWPHMTVAENVAYPLKIQGVSKAERDRRVEEALKMVHLDQYGRRYPNQLSGGQQQRVAFIRMLCQPADFMLLDEPMSHLDERNAAVMAGILLEEVRTNGTGVIVTSVGKRFEIEYDKVFSL